MADLRLFRCFFFLIFLLSFYSYIFLLLINFYFIFISPFNSIPLLPRLFSYFFHLFLSLYWCGFSSFPVFLFLYSYLTPFPSVCFHFSLCNFQKLWLTTTNILKPLVHCCSQVVLLCSVNTSVITIVTACCRVVKKLQFWQFISYQR
jgi:hypothetical protein